MQLATSEEMCLAKDDSIRDLKVKLSDMEDSCRTTVADLQLSLKAEAAATLEASQKELQKRGALARSVILEKEEEIRVCQSKLKELQLEIDQGAPGDRKFLALAEMQAMRDLNRGVQW